MAIKVWVGAAIGGPLQCDPMLLIQRSKTIDPRYPSEVQEKLVGGMYDPQRDENLFDTLNREVFEETDLKIRNGKELKIIHSQILGEVHKILYFVPFEYLVGIIRQKSKPDGNTMLEELHWETLDVVYRIIHPTQANLLEKAEKEMLIRY